MKNNSDHINTSVIDLAGLSRYLLSIRSIIITLVVWQVLKKRSIFLGGHEKEVLNFNMSLALYIFLLNIPFIPLSFTSFFSTFQGLQQTNKEEKYHSSITTINLIK
ncbi:DUF4870 domain-containing protein [Tenacibaculum maritimum]|uniref:DUF4870 domain-containing protein n=1 Tax=Tenacibaculum maritimum TaxID=107401 RepID=UPI0012E59FE5|nr:DUF4870 domain-containing protein [Tenacibaculum maritimum]CAA0161755.1 conserved hypothetical protein [Tenacibaculum maritimum]CAA0170625.1 conserved hypothetical protein [Tenacibaculum maritimum]